MFKDKFITSILLAAGQGKRMGGSLPKVLYPVLGKPLLEWALDSLSFSDHIQVVVSPHQKEVHEFLKQRYPQVFLTFQDPPLGTGHAVHCAVKDIVMSHNSHRAQNNSNLLEKPDSLVLIANGDTPGVRRDQYKNYISSHLDSKAPFSLVMVERDNPKGYGRVIRDSQGVFQSITEEKDCTEDERKIRFCNAGILCASLNVLNEYLPKLSNDNQAQEYYLTEIPNLLSQDHKPIHLVLEKEEEQIRGINTPEELMFLEAFLKKNHGI